MTKTHLPTRLPALLLLVGLATAFTLPGKNPGTLEKTIKVKNSTNFDIDHIYLSPDEEDHWGDDILHDNEILHPGDEIEVDVDCGKWDVKLVAEDKSACEVEDVTLCNAAQWNIVADCGH